MSSVCSQRESDSPCERTAQKFYAIDTYFAPAGRQPYDALHNAAEVLRAVPAVQAMIDALPLGVMLLNKQRQIVLANDTLLAILGSDLEHLLGKRPGEALGCVHASEGPDGCGTARQCACCGAVEAILAAQPGAGRTTRECHARCCTATGENALDLRVSAQHAELAGQSLTLVSVEDISQQNRLAALTRTFFHDVLNTAGGIQGYAHCLAARGADGGEDAFDCVRLAALSDQIVDEIEAQRDLLRAESGDLAVYVETVRPLTILENLSALYARHSVGLGKHIVLGDVWSGALQTDARLLFRALGNMLKNALEASQPGETVTAGCREQGSEVLFSVHNAAAIPPDVQMQIFHRSFSTKAAAGRGLGTYSIKLLGERYLHGRVAFTSNPTHGTTFTLRLPKLLD